jgi:hypothetical protein
MVPIRYMTVDSNVIQLLLQLAHQYQQSPGVKIASVLENVGHGEQRVPRPVVAVLYDLLQVVVDKLPPQGAHALPLDVIAVEVVDGRLDLAEDIVEALPEAGLVEVSERGEDLRRESRSESAKCRGGKIRQNGQTSWSVAVTLL